MDWWRKMKFPVRKIWSGVDSGFGMRNHGLFKLRHEVRRSEYRDIHIMWELLHRIEPTPDPETEGNQRRRKKPFWRIFSCVPYLFHGGY